MRKIIILLLTAVVMVPEVCLAWTQLAPGMDVGTFTLNKETDVDGVQITIVRIDPKNWEFVLIGKSWKDGLENQTARQWCETHQLSVAINAGMYGTDYRTHIGYLGTQEHVNNAHVNKYMSVAAFGLKANGKDLPEFRIFDLDDPQTTMKKILGQYASVVQNLRLIKRPGENRWPQQNKKWSETALGEDRVGRALFIYVGSPVSMHDLNHGLLSLGIGIVAAQHLEGGPEAQLYLNVGTVTREMFGQYGTGIRDDNRKINRWPVPNVIGVRPKSYIKD